MMDKTKEKVAHTPAVGVVGEQPSYMYNNTIIADAVDYGNLQTTEGVSMFERMGGQYEERDGILYPLISMEEVVLCQDLVQVKMRNFSPF